MKTRILVFIFLAAVVSAFALPATTQGQALFTAPPIEGGKTNPTVVLPNLIEWFNGKTTINDIVVTIVWLLATIGGIVAFGFVLYGGFRYLTAGENPARVQEAKKIIIGSIIGIIIMSLSYLVVVLIINTAKDIAGA
jgi:hypothetical protein